MLTAYRRPLLADSHLSCWLLRCLVPPEVVAGLDAKGEQSLAAILPELTTDGEALGPDLMCGAPPSYDDCDGGLPLVDAPGGGARHCSDFLAAHSPWEGDTKQQKIPFERVERVEDPRAKPEASTRSLDRTVGESMTGTTTIMAELPAGFRSIDALVSRLDCMGEKINHHATCLDGAEEHISGLEDGTTSLSKWVDKMEHLLKTMALKNEDLEARSLWYNIHIDGIVESTNMGCLDQFVERLLIELFDHQSFMDKVVIERAHQSLGP
ncbi:hypothetical protein NDU88_002754 [Pleurodeles waltl]|uniref:Uncharacterized protein n=1 Tax=Pleurodeles waltl TaxID=8319 RepID=A0AAV7T347_PLEWA|nr:hypothetical protein NDU88_002754 [Pleurodeles waltl]